MQIKQMLFYGTLISIIFLFIYWIINIKQETTTGVKQDFTSVSSGVIWDGTNLWVANSLQNAISKFNSTITYLTSFRSGAGVFQTLSLGAYIWATNYSENTLSIINTSDGSISSKINTESGPSGMAFDGTNIWVCNFGSSSCSVISQGSGNIITTIKVGAGPTCVLFDGTSIWVCCSASSQVYLLDVSSLQPKDVFTVGTRPFRMTVMNGIVYVLDASVNSSIYSIGVGGVSNRFTPDITACTDITNDGKYLYLSSPNGNVYVFDPVANSIKTGFDAGLEAKYIQIVNGAVIISDQTNNQLGQYTLIGGSPNIQTF